MVTLDDKLINLGRLKYYHSKLKTIVPILDSTSKIPSNYLPSYVDDVLEYANMSSFPTTGETGKIYVALDTNKTYRWGGTTYIEISASIVIGTTTGTAFPGDRGAAIEQGLGNLEHTVSGVQSEISDIDTTITSIKNYDFLYAKNTTKPVFNTATTSGSISFPTVEFNGPSVDVISVTIPTFTNNTAGLVAAPQHTDSTDVDILTNNGWSKLAFEFNSLNRNFQLYAGDSSNIIDSIYFNIPSASEFGFIRTGFAESGRNYAVKVNSSGDAYVTVPWTDNNTDTKVTQKVQNLTDAYYNLLVSGSSNGSVGGRNPTEETNYVNKAKSLVFSPLDNELQVYKDGVYSGISPDEIVVGEGTSNFISIQNGGIMVGNGTASQVFAADGSLMEITIATDAEIDAIFTEVTA